jgi:hypothetical protein
MGKFETMPAGGGRTGNVSRQQLPLGPWPICNRGHSQPLSIIGDFFFEDLEVSADILIESAGVGAGLALRVRNTCFFRGVTPGVYLFVGAERELASPRWICHPRVISLSFPWAGSRLSIGHECACHHTIEGVATILYVFFRGCLPSDPTDSQP